MRFLDFFAGVGGFRRGMELAGHTCVGFCEFDRFAVASYTSMHLITEDQRAYLATLPLQKRQKEILKDEYRNGEWYANDIRDVRGRDLPLADCVDDNTEAYAVWNEKAQGYIAIRKLTPRECFRLQGWTDDYFEKAAFVNSDTQLYKEAGNGITVNVVHAIAEMINEVTYED